MIRAAAAVLALALLGAAGGDARASGSGAVTASVVANPLAVSLALSAGQADLGIAVTATATTSNLGSGSLSNVVLTLRVDPSGLRIGGGETRSISSLAGGGTATGAWPLCGLAPGNYLVMVSAAAGAFTAESKAELLEVGSVSAGICPDDSSATVEPGGTVSTGADATSTDPLETSVTSPSGGLVSIDEQAAPTSAPSGLTVLGFQVQISAPSETPANPLTIAFTIDASLLPAGVDPLTIQVFRNGLAVPGCTGAAGTASPDPCLASRTLLAGGDLELVVLTSAASGWTFGTIYAFSGFFSPVANPPTLNAVQAGRAVPVKFSLGGDKGLAIFAAGYPRSVGIACDTAAPIGLVEETVTAGASSLSYDAASDQYVYVWKTDAAWAGTCRQLIVRLVDGTDHRANFRLR